MNKLSCLVVVLIITKVIGIACSVLQFPNKNYLLEPSNKAVVIITQAYNRPDFIRLQYTTFKMFLTNEYEFVVFNDASDETLKQAISSVCRECGLRCINVPQHIHTTNNASQRHADVIHYSLNNFGFKHQGLVMMVDSDLFLVKQFDAITFLASNSIAALPQSREHVKYLWPGLVLMNMATLPDATSMDWRPGQIGQIAVDTGGFTYYYLQKHPQLNIEYIHHTYNPVGRDELILQNMRNFKTPGEFFLDAHFFHMRAVSWCPEENEKKCRLLTQYLDELNVKK
jgi:hypothetical protein